MHLKSILSLFFYRELAETQLQCAVCNELFVEAVRYVV